MIQTQVVLARGTDLEAKAQRLLEVAQEYWEALNKEMHAGAVIWLSDSRGRTLFFTRGEQAESLKAHIQGPRFLDAQFADDASQPPAPPAQEQGKCGTCGGSGVVKYPIQGDSAPCPFCGDTGIKAGG